MSIISSRAGQLSAPSCWARAVATPCSTSSPRPSVAIASARSSAAGSVSGRVGADPIWVQGGDLAGYSDAVDCHGVRPGVAGELGGEVAGEVCPVGGVAGDAGDGQFLHVEQPDLVVVIGADGDQQRVGRRLVDHVGSQLVEVDVERHGPALVVGVLPGATAGRTAG